MTMIERDDAYDFGLGIFTTIAVEDGKALLVERHLKRLKDSMKVLQICNSCAEEGLTAERINFEASQCPKGRQALKISVSEKNLLFSNRPNKYTKRDYERGFRLSVSQVMRNETSLLTYHKTMNYADNIMEKRKSVSAGFDEPIFFNTRGEVAEGAATNIFFWRNGKLYTPPVASGILPGVMRGCIMEHLDVQEAAFRYEDVMAAEGVFVTNALLGIMPVAEIAGRLFSAHESTWKVHEIIAGKI